MNSNILRMMLAATETGITYEIGRPWLALVMIPAVALAIVPFFRLHKSRRYSMKHMVPLFIHIIILAIATMLITDIHAVQTQKAPEETQIVVVVDMSDSNSPMKDEMNAYIKDLHANKSSKTEIAVVVFGDDHITLHDFNETADDYLSLKEGSIKSAATNIQTAIEYAETLFEQINLVNKRILLMSDGRQTIGNAWSAVTKLSQDKIRLDAAYFDVTKDPENAEVQLLSIKSTEIETKKANVSVSISLKATKATMGKVKLYEVGQVGNEDVLVYEEDVNLKKGGNSFSFQYMAEGTGIHSVYATVEVADDTVKQNNTLYSWFTVKGKANIMLVDGDGSQVSNKITKFLDDEYEYTVVEVDSATGKYAVPGSMEELLKYDEIVLMNIDFELVPTGFVDLVKRYVEEVGRGLVFTCGSNSYKNNALADNPLASILPIDLKIDERRETIATVITVDLSSSMGQEVPNQTNRYGEKMTRYDMVLESVLKLLDTEEFTEEDYIGVVLFDTDSTVALPITQLDEKAYMKEYLEQSFEEYFYEHNLKQGEVASFENRIRSDSGTRDANGFRIKAYGTMYGNGISKANILLGESDADLKQMVFLSDGEPQDQGSGYDSTIRRMANQGILTSTIGIGNLSTKAESELSTLATLGKGKFTQVDDSLDLEQSLVQIAETIKGDYKNERPTKLEKRNEGKITIGLGDELDTIGGYYGTTIKNGAKMIISADDLRPIIAEWDVGHGHTTVYMSDLGGVWSYSLFSKGEDNPDNEVLVKNLLVNSINTEINSSGLKIDSHRDGDTTRITVETLKRVRADEQLVLYVTEPSGTSYSLTGFDRAADTKYSKVITTPNETGTYLIEVRLEKAGEKPILFDRANYAVVGFYPDEYDLFSTDGKSVMEDVSAAGKGKIMTNAKDFYDIVREKFIQTEKDIVTPSLIILLLLFIIDLLFRNFSPKKEKKKKIMTDEEQIESMRGR